jgi:flavin-dependent dehydrogenase
MTSGAGAPGSFDVAVIGGGPAAAVVAQRLVSIGASVALCRGPARYRQSVELVSGHAVRMLREAVGWTPFGIPVAETRSMWGSSEILSWPSMLQPYGGGVVIERDAFDRSLLTSTGATECPGLVRRAEWSQGRWSLIRDRAVVRADRLVLATGRAASVVPRGRRTVAAHGGPATALTTRVVLDAGRAGDAALLLERASTGWWWSLPAPSGVTFVGRWWPGRLPHQVSDISAWWWSEFQATRLVGAGAPSGPGRSTVDVRAAAPTAWTHAATGRWIAVGDAAFAPNPLSGQGIEFAVASADAAADVLDGKQTTRAYRRWVDTVIAGHEAAQGRVGSWAA